MKFTLGKQIRHERDPESDAWFKWTLIVVAIIAIATMVAEWTVTA